MARRHRRRHPPLTAPGQGGRRRSQSHRRERPAARLRAVGRKEGEVIRPAKLWCDTSTAAECEEITEKLGGLKPTIRALGNAVLPGFTASKILWLKVHEPKNYQRLATVLLPHGD